MPTTSTVRNRQAQTPTVERRFVKGAEVRAKVGGKPGIEGYGAVFGEEYVLWDSPTLRIVETIKQGTFKRAIDERQDVRCLFNHQPDNILGRTANNTMQMAEDTKGLRFDADFDMRTSIANNVRCFVERGDVTGCSFSFQVKKQTRTEVEDNEKLIVKREIEDVDLFDVGPVTYPAYEGTGVTARAVELRSLFPEGIPDSVMVHAPELREIRITDTLDDPGDGGDDEPDDDDVKECACRCRACFSGECSACDQYMETCADPEHCSDAMRSARPVSEQRDDKNTKRVAGEDLPSSSFAYVGSADDKATWKLPIKFSSEEKSKSHVRNALARWSSTDMPNADAKAKAWKKLVAAAHKYGIHVEGEDDKASKSAEISLEQAKARTATLQADLSQLV
jgi:HK97 family phage prohead protease